MSLKKWLFGAFLMASISSCSAPPKSGGSGASTFDTVALRSSIKIGDATEKLLQDYGAPSKRIEDPKPGDAEWWYTDHDGKRLLIVDIKGGKVAAID